MGQMPASLSGAGICLVLFLWGEMAQLKERGKQMAARNKMRRFMQQGEKDKVRPANVARTEARHDRNREGQEIRRQANVVRRHMGTATPWELACQARRQRRFEERFGLAA